MGTRLAVTVAGDVVRPTLLVGSFPYRDARETLRVSGPLLAGYAKRLTDGEAQGWTVFAARTIPDAEGVEREPSILDLPNRRVLRYRVSQDGTARRPRFRPAGYEEVVASSYAVFRELRDTGVIASGTRFQQSLPTPLGVIAQHFISPHVPLVLDHFQDAHFADVQGVLERVPHADLALQWDVAVEVINCLERQDPILAELYPLEAVAARIAAAVDFIPADVEVGIHLCYGNPGGRHVLEPQDLSKVVALCNAVCAQVSRPLDWVHMPVPVERNDEPYFAPLAELAMQKDTELYLGLVHLRDGLEGGTRRITAAKQFRSDFGVATECGFRYVATHDVPALLELHRELGRVR